MLVKILQSIQNLFAPKRCYRCGLYGDFLCQHCATDFDAFLNQLMDTGYQGYLVIEQAWSEPQGNWKEDLTSAFPRFSKWCE